MSARRGNPNDRRNVKIFVVSPIHLLTTVNERYGLIEKVNFRFARDPGVSEIDSHKAASVLISQACLRRHSSEMMDRIAKGPEDVKKSVRAADELL